MLTLLLILLGLLLSILGFEHNEALSRIFTSGKETGLGGLVGWIGTVLSCGAAIQQYCETKPYQFIFSDDVWRSVSDGFEIKIHKRKHKKGNHPNVSVYSKTIAGYEEAILAIKILSDGTIILNARPRFSGKVIVR